MLCNKADADDAKDDRYIVDSLKVERLVNEAKCPTRVEQSVANKNQGLREGFKWLVKSIIAHLPELGPRVELDVEEERLKEDLRRAEVRKRMEEKRRRENDGIEEEEEELPGFVPIEKCNVLASLKPSKAPVQPQIVQEEDSDDNEESCEGTPSPNPSIRVYASSVVGEKSPSPPPYPTPSPNSPSDASPPVAPPPPQPGPHGPPPEPAPAGKSITPPPPNMTKVTTPTPLNVTKSLTPTPQNVTHSNGSIPISSPLPNVCLPAPPSSTTSVINDYSPRTPLPPIENSLPSPFLQLSLDSRNVPSNLVNDTSKDNLSITGDQVVDAGGASVVTEVGVTMNSSVNQEGISSDTSSVFESKRNSLTGSITSQGGPNRRNSSASSNGTRRLELEPIIRAKKKTVLKKVVNNNYKVSVAANADSKSISGSSNGGSKPSSKPGSRANSAYSRRSSLVFKPIVNW